VQLAPTWSGLSVGTLSAQQLSINCLAQELCLRFGLPERPFDPGYSPDRQARHYRLEIDLPPSHLHPHKWLIALC
jgi:hypothetical protein